MSASAKPRLSPSHPDLLRNDLSRYDSLPVSREPRLDRQNSSGENALLDLLCNDLTRYDSLPVPRERRLDCQNSAREKPPEAKVSGALVLSIISEDLGESEKVGEPDVGPDDEPDAGPNLEPEVPDEQEGC